MVVSLSTPTIAIANGVAPDDPALLPVRGNNDEFDTGMMRFRPKLKEQV